MILTQASVRKTWAKQERMWSNVKCVTTLATGPWQLWKKCISLLSRYICWVFRISQNNFTVTQCLRMGGKEEENPCAPIPPLSCFPLDQIPPMWSPWAPSSSSCHLALPEASHHIDALCNGAVCRRSIYATYMCQNMPLWHKVILS